jgi:hypothetical protein
MAGFNDTLTGNLKNEIDRLSRYAKDLEVQASDLNHENLRLRINQNEANENIRLILLEAVAEDLDVQTVANSVADVLGISLLREITVTIPLVVEATMLVPADFDIEHFEVGELNLDCYNTDVEDFCVQSFDVGDIEES